MRVPTYQDSQQVQVVRQPVPRGTTRFPALARFGGAVQDLGSLLEQRQQIRDESDASNALNAYAEEAITFKNELEQKKGAEARSVSDDYKKWHQNAVQRYKKEYTHNPNSEAIFNRYATKHYLSKIGALAKYQAQEERFYIESVLARDLQNIEAEVTDDPYATIEVEGGEILAVEDRIQAYHDKAALILGGAYTQDAAGDIDAKIKSATLTGMIVQDPTRVEPFLERWKIDIGSKAYSTFKAKAKGEIIKKQVDSIYDLARDMDIDDAEDFINNSGLPTANRRQLLSNIRTDYDRKQREIERQQTEIKAQNNLDLIESYYNNDPNVESNADTLAEGQQIDLATYKWLKNEIREGQKVTENNPDVVGDIAALIEFKNYKEAASSLSEALQDGQIKGETYITMTRSLASKAVSDAIGYINRAMQPSELEIDFFKKQKHADAIVDLGIRIANQENPIEAARDIARLDRTTQLQSLMRFRNPRFLKPGGDKTDMIDIADAEFNTIEALRQEQISEDEYRNEMELINNIRDAIIDRENQKATSEDLEKAIKDLKVGQ